MANRSGRFAFGLLSGTTAVAMAAALAAAPAAQAQQDFDFLRDCARYLEKQGYSRDYIRLKVGKVQPGVPMQWRGNVEPREVQPGDVVMSLIKDKGKTMRAGYVDEVRRNADGTAGAVLVSEWNWGKYVDERCFVSDHFGMVTHSVITIDGVVRVWRPSLPL